MSLALPIQKTENTLLDTRKRALRNLRKDTLYMHTLLYPRDPSAARREPQTEHEKEANNFGERSPNYECGSPRSTPFIADHVFLPSTTRRQVRAPPRSEYLINPGETRAAAAAAAAFFLRLLCSHPRGIRRFIACSPPLEVTPENRAHANIAWGMLRKGVSHATTPSPPVTHALVGSQQSERGWWFLAGHFNPLRSVSKILVSSERIPNSRRLENDLGESAQRRESRVRRFLFWYPSSR